MDFEVQRKWLKLWIEPLDFAFHNFKLTDAESEAIKKYSHVRTQITTSIKPIDEFNSLFYQLTACPVEVHPSRDGFFH